MLRLREPTELLWIGKWVGYLGSLPWGARACSRPVLWALYACKSRVAKFPYSERLPTNHVDDHDDNAAHNRSKPLQVTCKQIISMLRL